MNWSHAHKASTHVYLFNKNVSMCFFDDSPVETRPPTPDAPMTPRWRIPDERDVARRLKGQMECRLCHEMYVICLIERLPCVPCGRSVALCPHCQGVPKIVCGACQTLV